MRDLSSKIKWHLFFRTWCIYFILCLLFTMNIVCIMWSEWSCKLLTDQLTRVSQWLKSEVMSIWTNITLYTAVLLQSTLHTYTRMMSANMRQLQHLQHRHHTLCVYSSDVTKWLPSSNTATWLNALYKNVAQLHVVYTCTRMTAL